MRLLAAALILLMMACDDPGDDNKNEGHGGEGEQPMPYGKLVITSSDAASASLAEEEPESCTMFAGSATRADGVCITPITLGGVAVRASFSHNGDDPHLRGAVRVFSQDERVEKPGTILEGAVFDIADPTKNLVGNNQFAGGVSGSSDATFRDDPLPLWSSAVIDMNYLKYQVKVAGKFVTVILPAFPQPLGVAATFAGCSPQPSSDILTQERFTEAELLPGMTFQNGDYLFCVKDTQAAACAASDYKWLDTATGTLVATRPSAPRQAPAQKGTIACTVEESEERYDLQIPEIPLRTNFANSTTFKLHADYSHGELSQQWKDATTPFDEEQAEGVAYSPFPYYTYEPTGGTASSGTNLEIKLDYSVKGLIFIALDDLTGKTVEEILASIQTRSGWIADRASESTAPGGGVGNPNEQSINDVTVTVTVSGGTAAPTEFIDLFNASGQTDKNPDQ